MSSFDKRARELDYSSALRQARERAESVLASSAKTLDAPRVDPATVAPWQPVRDDTHAGTIPQRSVRTVRQIQDDARDEAARDADRARKTINIRALIAAIGEVIGLERQSVAEQVERLQTQLDEINTRLTAVEAKLDGSVIKPAEPEEAP